MNYLKNLLLKLLSNRTAPPQPTREEQVDEYLEELEKWVEMYERM